MFAEDGSVRPHYAAFADWLRETPPERIAQNRHAADLLFHRVGITFAVYGEASGTERLIPFDIVPHVIPGAQWDRLAAGLRQRVDGAQPLPARHLPRPGDPRAPGTIPREDVEGNSQFRREMVGVDVPGGIYAHVAGVDLVRNADGEYYVLEDNLRTPSGVSYMLENRKMMMRLFPELFAAAVASARWTTTRTCCSRRCARSRRATSTNPVIVLLTPGPLQQRLLRARLPRPADGHRAGRGPGPLRRRTGTVFMRTTQGPQRVDVIYRRIDDDFLDPLAFRPDSMLGVPGLLDAYRAGRVTLANAIGTGVADDKSMYPYVPEMIRFYLGEEPILANVPTYLLRDPDDLAYTLDHLEDLVVKETQGSGGYGMLVGPDRDEGGAREVPAPHPRRARALHRPAHALAVAGADLLRRRAGRPAHRPAALRPVGARGALRPRRPHARGPARGLPRRELLPGRRGEGHLGGGLTRVMRAQTFGTRMNTDERG